MSNGHSVTAWIEELKRGNPEGAQGLWQRYFARLVEMARARLRGRVRRVADEEDIALSAFDSFCHRVERGSFPELNDRNNLWCLLHTITAGKVNDLLAREMALKRGGGAVRGDSAVGGSEGAGFEAFAKVEPTPEEAALFADECERLLKILDDRQREIAKAKLEGLTDREVAARLGCSERTVKRELAVIRLAWAGEKPS